MTRDALCLRDQPASNRILQSICRLFFGAFARADRVVKQTSLPPMLRLAQLLYGKGLLSGLISPVPGKQCSSGRCRHTDNVAGCRQRSGRPKH
jgi:hypothetical protein